MIQAKPTIVELDMDKREEILRRLEAKELDAEDYETIKAVIGAYVHLFQLVGDKETTIRRLRQILFGAKTEKTSAVIGGLKGRRVCRCQRRRDARSRHARRGS
jgi:hypothetical protein